MTTYRIALFMSLLFLCPAVSVSGQDDVSISAFNSKQRPSAFFEHDEHNEKAELEDCNTCHHVYQGGKRMENESSEDMPCSDCHNASPGFPTRTLIRAYHDLCKSCHMENRTGPIMCGECHSRRS